MTVTLEEINARTKGVTTWEELKKIYLEIGVITPRDLERDEIFNKAEGILIERHERGEINDLEYSRLIIELEHGHTRACSQLYDEEFGAPEEHSEVDEWLAELDKIIAARNTGKISIDEYWRLCFELDKKYYFADEDDAVLYLDIDAEENFPARISANA